MIVFKRVVNSFLRYFNLVIVSVASEASKSKDVFTCE